MAADGSVAAASSQADCCAPCNPGRAICSIWHVQNSKSGARAPLLFLQGWIDAAGGLSIRQAEMVDLLSNGLEGFAQVIAVGGVEEVAA